MKIPKITRRTSLGTNATLYVLLLLFILAGPVALTQTPAGIKGYVRIPSATFNPDGSMYLGSGFFPRKYLPFPDKGFFSKEYDAYTVFASLTFLPFVEVDLRVTGMLDHPDTYKFGLDRVPSVRFRILKEKRWIPAVVAGFQDVLTSVENGSPRLFGASYLVVTKNFHIPQIFLNIEATAGYGSEWFIWQNTELIGAFGGIAVSCDKFKWITFMIDYDGQTPNAGLRLEFFKHLNLMAGFLNFDSFTGTIS